MPILRDPARTTSESEAVFYFPGCGSERLFSQVGLATQAMLWHVGRADRAAAGLPLLRLPADAARASSTQAREDHHRQPRAVPSRRQHAQLSRHPYRAWCRCGTCFDQLQDYEFDKIFPGCRIIDIHEFLLEKGVRLEGVTGVRYMYHDPCHSPISTGDPLKSSIPSSEPDLHGPSRRTSAAAASPAPSRSRARTSRRRCASASSSEMEQGAARLARTASTAR